jgi:hypothetical protein
MHDPRVGRFFAVDPLFRDFPYNSPYAFSENRVIDMIELEGLEVCDIKARQLDMSLIQGKITEEEYIEQKRISFSYGILGLAYITDIFLTKGKLSQALIGGGLLESINETERAYDEKSKGNENSYRLRIQRSGEASKIVVFGILAHGASFTIGKIVNSVKNIKTQNVKLLNSNEVNKSFTDNNLHAPYKPNVTIGEAELVNNINAVRLSGPNNVEGSWFTTLEEVKGLTAAQLKNKFSLKYEPTMITPVTINKSSTVRVGEAASVKAFKTDGGGFQMEVLNGKVTYGKSELIGQ